MNPLAIQDAHLHLQSTPLLESCDAILALCEKEHINRMVVNGTSPDDWDEVSRLAQKYKTKIIPSFGLHPWWVMENFDNWQDVLTNKINLHANACIGECGLDKWKNGLDKCKQEQAFIYQLTLAHEHNLPLSIHVLKAWGWLLKILKEHPIPDRGFLIHSFSGSAEIAKELVDYGAYFSFSGYFLHPHKLKQQKIFKKIPRNRILIETDAPDMLPPISAVSHPLPGDSNHPANLRHIFNGFAEILEESELNLASQLSENFLCFFVK